jgi:N-acetylmuramoyl-L-alanine amidase
MRNKIVIILCVLLLGNEVLLAKPKFVSVVARSGDGVLALLRRFHVSDYECNLDKFYNLNGMDDDENLEKGKRYQLPIFEIKYNGKNIRSSADCDVDVAKRIENYNERVVKEDLKPERFQKDKLLWVPYHELYCPEDKIENVEAKAISSTGKPIPIFDKGDVSKKDNALKGKVYYIDAGHGGPDPGSMGKWKGKTICEDEYAYDVSIRLAKNLLEHNAIVYMVTRDPNDGIRDGSYLPCDDDEVHWENDPMPLDQKQRLQDRADAINRLYKKHRRQGVSDSNQKLIIIHIDSRSKKEQTDVFFYFKPGSRAGQRLAIKCQNIFANKYPKGRDYDGSVTGRDLMMLRETKPISVYVEMGNIQNPSDQQRFIIDTNRQTMANWLYEGIK